MQLHIDLRLWVLNPLKGLMFMSGILFGNIATSANAQLEELRVGISQFDASIFGIGISSGRASEKSPAINGEIIFAEPELLKWAYTPQPFINATLNLDGETSFAGAGLLWRQTFGDKFYADFAFGLVIHDGTDDLEPDTGENFLDFLDRFEDTIAFGSRILFREQLTFGYRINDNWAGEIFGEHLSNGQIFGTINEGADTLGIRAARRF